MGERERILVVDAGRKAPYRAFPPGFQTYFGALEKFVFSGSRVCAVTRSAEERGTSFDSPKSRSRGSRRAKTAPIVGNS
jgi:hypothetical protein